MLYTHVPDIGCFYSDEVADGLSMPTAHFEYEMILITSGKASAVINHKTYPLKKGSLVFISRLERHTFHILEEPYCRYVVSVSSNLLMSHIKETELISIFIQRPANFAHVIQLDEEIYPTILSLFHEMAEEYALQQDFFIACSVSLFMSILIQLYRTYPGSFPMHSHSPMAEAVLQAQRYVSEHFNRKLTLQEIADKNFVSRHGLSLAFKEMTGITFKEYLLLFRITEAKNLLATTNLPVSQIAEQVGYVNVNNFVKIFKKLQHTTPLQYRKSILSPGSK